MRENLQEDLNLSDFVNLEELWCDHNKLTSLDISKCEKLSIVWCSDNELTKIVFGNNKKLRVLFMLVNKFKDLSFFENKELPNLEEIQMHEDYPDISTLSGSLKPLEKCVKLKKLCIDRTKIDSGLEYLPKSCVELHCNERDKIAKSPILRKYGNNVCSNDEKYVKQP
jgi:Leucine-rich repeat (LRR) protein